MADFSVIIFLSIAIIIFSKLFFHLPDSEYNGAEYAKVYDLETIHSKRTPLSAFNVEKQIYNFGRYRKPVKNLNLHQLTAFQKFAQLKEFAYTAVADEEWFIGSALLQFHYNAAAIVYVYNTKSNQSHILQLELPLVSFLGTNFDDSTSVLNGCVTWNKTLGFTGKKCFNNEEHNYDVELSGTFNDGVKFEIDYSISLDGESMSMIFPIGPKRPALVTKFGGALSAAAMRLNGKEYVLSNPLGMMDWTRGLLRRLTYWHWLAMSWTDGQNNAYGLQLSEGTYDNANGVSLESTLWINDKAHHVNSKIIFTQLTKEVKPYESDWMVQSEDGSVDLRFRFGNVIKGSFHYFILDGDLFHMWGLYSGTIKFGDEVIRVENVPGTLEDHYALW